MIDELRQRWYALKPEERFPFEMIAEEDRLEFNAAMKKIDEKYFVL